MSALALYIMALNNEQLQATKIHKGPLLILAGAGTGKTTTLIERIKNMVDSGINPYNILAVTFTNKAANEMRERVRSSISFEKSGLLHLSTFHSLCLRILKEEYYNPITKSTEFKLSSPANCATICKGFMDKKIRVKGSTIASYISKLKNELVSATDFTNFVLFDDTSNKNVDWDTVREKVAEIPSDHLFILKTVYPKFESYMKSQDMLDFDDLLFETAKLFLKDPLTLDKYQDIYKYIMIDEYQDTNNAQYLIVKLLASKYQNLAVVGDDYQAIYGFRGSDIRNILNFSKDYPSAVIIKLVQNYRSQKHIIDSANSVISNNVNQMHKKLLANIDAGEKIRIVRSKNYKDTAGVIAEEILDSVRKNDTTFSDHAILYRNNSMAADVEMIFHQLKVPFVKLSGLDFFEYEEIKDIITYLSLIHNTNDIEAFSRVIMKPRRRIAEKTIKKIIVDHFEDDLLHVLDDLSSVERVQRIAIAEGQKFSELIRKYQRMAKTESVATIITGLLDDINYYELVIGNYEPERQEEKKQNIAKMIELIRSEEREIERYVLLEEYVENIMLYNGNSDEHGDCVKLMTFHGSKGLEFPVVHLLNFNRDQFPSVRVGFGGPIDPIALTKAWEEERRLCYVALTRAKRILNIHCQREHIKKDGNRSELSPSPFISELAEHTLHFEY